MRCVTSAVARSRDTAELALPGRWCRPLEGGFELHAVSEKRGWARSTRLAGGKLLLDPQAVAGHGEAEKALLDAYLEGRMAQSWILGGRAGIGKATLAWRFARFALANPDPARARANNPVSLHVPGWWGGEEQFIGRLRQADFPTAAEREDFRQVRRPLGAGRPPRQRHTLRVAHKVIMCVILDA